MSYYPYRLRGKKCPTCGRLFIYLMQEKCDSCHTLESLIRGNPGLAEKVLQDIKAEPVKVKKEEKVKGVYWCKSKKKWLSRFWNGEVEKSLGSFENKNDAIKARLKADEMYGGF